MEELRRVRTRIPRDREVAALLDLPAPRAVPLPQEGVTESRSCWVCKIPCGPRLVCKTCQKYLTDAEHKRLTILYSDLVVAKGYDPVSGLYRCRHCDELFPRDEIAPDHFPITKGSSEAVRFDLDAAWPSCGPCNTSGNNNRKESMKAHPKYDLCSECRFLLAARDGLCYRCIQKPTEGLQSSVAPGS
jgi:hypothetical protein